jgi:hypothetical protein
VENVTLLQGVLAHSAAVMPAVVLAAPLAVLAPPPAPHPAMWLAPQPTTLSLGRHAKRDKGCCGWPSAGHPLRREDCPHQHEVKQGYPTKGPLPGGRVCTLEDVRARKWQRTDAHD